MPGITKTTQPTCSANDVAQYFIYLASKANKEGEVEGVTNLKLQKILYFAQAYYLAKLDRELFEEDIQAWQFGPVIPSVYSRYKQHGNRAIIELSDGSKIPEKDKEILEGIWDTFGRYTASRLVDIVHAHSPWKEAYVPGKKNSVITKQTLKDYYSPLLNK